MVIEIHQQGKIKWLAVDSVSVNSGNIEVYKEGSVHETFCFNDKACKTYSGTMRKTRVSKVVLHIDGKETVLWDEEYDYAIV